MKERISFYLNEEKIETESPDCSYLEFYDLFTFLENVGKWLLLVLKYPCRYQMVQSCVHDIWGIAYFWIYRRYFTEEFKRKKHSLTLLMRSKYLFRSELGQGWERSETQWSNIISCRSLKFEKKITDLDHLFIFEQKM